LLPLLRQNKKRIGYINTITKVAAATGEPATGAANKGGEAVTKQQPQEEQPWKLVPSSSHKSVPEGGATTEQPPQEPVATGVAIRE
jgi:hypothetical protein